MGEGKRCHAGQELRRNVRAVHEQHSQLFRAQAQFSSSGNAVSDSSAAPARAYPPPAPLSECARGLLAAQIRPFVALLIRECDLQRLALPALTAAELVLLGPSA